jgi:hypothetical protein
MAENSCCRLQDQNKFDSGVSAMEYGEKSNYLGEDIHYQKQNLWVLYEK